MPRKGGVPENLVNFQKGFDPKRNYKGRPRSIYVELGEILKETIKDKKSGKYTDKGKAILYTLVGLALKGDIRAIQEILDRLYGKARQEIELHLPELRVETMTDEERDDINKSLKILDESNIDILSEPPGSNSE